MRHHLNAVLLLAAAGCRGGGSGGEADSTEGSSEGSDGSSTDESGEGDESDTDDEGCDPVFCGDLAIPPECGNAKVEPGEDCDGAVAHAVCENCSVVCDDGYWDCNADPEDGCEIDLQADALNCGDCDRDCLGTPCADGRCQPVVIAQDEPAPTNVAVRAGFVYWTNFTGAGSVVRATVDGADRSELCTAPDPFDLAVDDDRVWFTAADQVSSVPVEGGMPAAFASQTGDPRGLALDADAVHFVDTGMSGADLVRRDKMGGSPTVLVPAAVGPRFLAIVGTDLYWSDDQALEVTRVATDGMGAPEPLAGAEQAPWDIAGTADILVWTNLADVGEVRWLALENLEDVRTLALAVRPWGITADDEFVYWTSEGDGTVQRSAVDGEQELAETVAFDQQTPRGIAHDDEFLYWADTAAGTIVKLRK